MGDERRLRERVLLQRADAPFAEIGVNLRVLWPGRSKLLYHSEPSQEDFLVLAGECLLLVGGEERPLSRLGLRPLPADDRACFRRDG